MTVDEVEKLRQQGYERIYWLENLL
jgi:hypothetical protein